MRGLPPSLGGGGGGVVTGAWLTQRKMAVNGSVFESECLHLFSVLCIRHAVNSVCLRIEGIFFVQGERSKWDGWLDV